MNYAIINNGKVTVICDSEPCPDDLATRNEICVICDSTVNTGYIYDGIIFSPPVPLQLTDAEKVAKYKQQRDILLSTTDDIYACDDYTFYGQILTTEQREELKIYRQALRDAPEKLYPEWPTKPNWFSTINS